VGSRTRTTTFNGLKSGVHYYVVVSAESNVGNGPGQFSNEAVVGSGHRIAPDPPPNGTRLCGRLRYGQIVVDAAAGAVRICKAGVIVPLGSTLAISGMAGPVSIIASGAGGITVEGGDVHTGGTTQARDVRIDSADPLDPWNGIIFTLWFTQGFYYPSQSPATAYNGMLDLEWVRLSHSKRGVDMETSGNRVRLSHVTVDGTNLASISVVGASAELDHVRVDNTKTGILLSCAIAVECRVRVTRTAISRVIAPGLSVAGATPLIARDDLITRTAAPPGKERTAAVRLFSTTFSTDPTTGVTTLYGANNSLGVVEFVNVTITGDLTWRPIPPREPMRPQSLAFANGGITMAPGTTLTVPPNATFVTATAREYGRQLTLDSAQLESGEGALFTGASDPDLPTSLCDTALADECESDNDDPDWGGIVVQDNSTVLLSGAEIRRAEIALFVLTRNFATAPTVQLERTRIADTGFGLRTDIKTSTYNNELAGTLDVTELTIENGGGIEADGFAVVRVKNLVARHAGSFRFSGLNNQDTYDEPFLMNFDPPAVVSLEHLDLDDSDGLTVDHVIHPQVHDVRVSNSRNNRWASLLVRPVNLISNTMSLGPDGDITDVVGHSNPVDAMAISGTLTRNLIWRTPISTTTDAPFGYVLAHRGLEVGSNLSLTFPRGAIAKADYSARLSLSNATLDASAGDAVFTSTADDSVGVTTCSAACDVPLTRWQGIIGTSNSQLTQLPDQPVQVRLVNADVRHGRIEVSGEYPTPNSSREGTLDLDGVQVSDTVRTARLASVTVINSTVEYELESRGDGTVVYTNDVAGDVFVQALKDNASFNYDDRFFQPDLLMRDVTATSQTRAGFKLEGVRTTIGPGAQIDRLRGVGNGAVLFLVGVALDDDLRWVTPRTTPEVHDVGFVASGLLFKNSSSMRVPPGSVVKASQLVFYGGDLDGRFATGAKFVHLADQTVGVNTCIDPYLSVNFGTCSRPGNDLRPHMFATLTPDPQTQNTGVATLNGVSMRGRLSATGGANDPDDMTHARMLSSNADDVDLTHASAEAALSTFGRVIVRDGNLTLRQSTVTKSDFYPVPDGVSITGNGHMTLDRVSLHDLVDYVPSPYEFAHAVTITGAASAAISCTEITNNGGGIGADTTGEVTVVDSNLFGNANGSVTYPVYDLHDVSPVSSTRVWWGQAGGPTANQVSHPANNTDTEPSALPVPCASTPSV
jgi:hypothetical protein